MKAKKKAVLEYDDLSRSQREAIGRNVLFFVSSSCEEIGEAVMVWETCFSTDAWLCDVTSFLFENNLQLFQI